MLCYFKNLSGETFETAKFDQNIVRKADGDKKIDSNVVVIDGTDAEDTAYGLNEVNNSVVQSPLQEKKVFNDKSQGKVTE